MSQNQSNISDVLKSETSCTSSYKPIITFTSDGIYSYIPSDRSRTEFDGDEVNTFVRSNVQSETIDRSFGVVDSDDDSEDDYDYTLRINPNTPLLPITFSRRKSTEPTSESKTKTESKAKTESESEAPSDRTTSTTQPETTDQQKDDEESYGLFDVLLAYHQAKRLKALLDLIEKVNAKAREDFMFEISPKLYKVVKEYADTLPFQGVAKQRLCDLKMSLTQLVLSNETTYTKFVTIQNGFLKENLILKGETPVPQRIQDSKNIENDLETIKKFMKNYIVTELENKKEKIFDEDDMVAIYETLISKTILMVIEKFLSRHSTEYDELRNSVKEIIKGTGDFGTKIEKITVLLI